ncbi:MAG: septum formation protein Maf [Alphaproteobacteria bacterium]|nr:septum formation protein Maf [Alphaproteobacteria bacterium]
MKLLLASRSEARRAMLDAAGIPYSAVEAELDEASAKSGLIGAGFGGSEVAEELAQLKALSVVADEGELVLGSDQILETASGELLGKPESRAHAFDQLAALRGATHRLHSAAVIVERGRSIWAATESVALTMRSFSDAFLADYLEREYDRIRWSVGCYQIEGAGVQLFERIEGSHFAILGMPLLPLLIYLRERGLIAR